MKKLFIATGLLLLTIAVTSCAKDKTCECKVTHEQSGPGFSETKSETKSHTIKAKESDASAACKGASYDISYTDQGGYSQKVKSDCAIR